MNEVIPFHPDQNRNLGRRQCIATWLRIFAGTKKLPSGFDLTEETAKLFEFTLRHFSLEQIERVFERADRELDWFPQPVEVRNLIDTSLARDAAYTRLKAAYEEEYRQGHAEFKSLPTALDETQFAPHGPHREEFIRQREAIAAAGGFEEFRTQQLLGDGPAENVEQALAALSTPVEVKGLVLTRRQKIICGLEQASVADDPVRLEMLRQQAAELRRRARREDPDYDQKENHREWLRYRPAMDEEQLTGLS
jgi:hypothetical protein